MLPALERLLKMYVPLKSFLQTMFNPLTEFWLAFVHVNLTIFSDTIQMLEGQEHCALESDAILQNFETKLSARKDDIIPVLVRGLLRELEENGAMFKASSQDIPVILHYCCELFASMVKANRQSKRFALSKATSM